MKLAGALADARSQSSLPLGVDAVQPQISASPTKAPRTVPTGARGVQLTMRSVPRRTVVSCPRWLQG